MGANNQADADNSTAGTEDSSVQDKPFNPDDVSSADDFEAAVEAVAATPVNTGTIEKDKELSKLDEEDNSDPDGESGIVDPDEETDGDNASDSDKDADSDSDDADESSGDDDADADSDADGDGDSDSDDSDADQDGDDDSDGDDASDAEKQERFRVRSKDPLTKETLRVLGRNRDLDVDEAKELARKNLIAQGVLQDKSADGDDASDDADGMPGTVDATETRIAELEKQNKTAMEEDFDFTKASELQAEIGKLSRHIGTLQIKAHQSEQEAAQASRAEYIQTFNSSQKKAEEKYDFVKDRESKGSKLMSDIDARLKEAGDPRFDDPNKPLLVAQMAAKELGIPPLGKTVKKSPEDGKPGSPKAPGKKAIVQPARADSRTKEKTDTGQLDERIDGIGSVEDYENLIYGEAVR